MKPRVRFAPSPTGFLHIGGARTALFNWLYARHAGGTFILRIEDTDAARNTQAAVEVILNGLRWLGLDWDEGPLSGDPAGPSRGDYGPYFQSRRRDIYQRRIEALLAKGLAYEADGTIKFKMDRAPILIPDLVVGDVRRELTDREQADPDFIIVRSDGQPVFHFVNVVDDLEMGITHVIRGEDHLSNTAKHIALFRALDADPPQYAHIPLILNSDGTKMSKRDQGASLMTYGEEGYLPEALVNYLCLLGWSPKGNREKMPLAEVIAAFDLPQILRHNARFDLAKLVWLNGEYLRELSDERFYELSAEALRRGGLELARYPDAYVRAALETCKGKVKLFSELPAYAGFYFTDEIKYDPAAAEKEFTPENRPRVDKLRAALAKLEPFEPDPIGATLKAVAQELGVKTGVLVHPTRLACCGNTAGPSLYHLLAILGKDRALARLDQALARMV
ncbi:MAG TPA: glutamate--tRNA ligase family protein [Verrucomicrobiota bacterium]|nr:glutamate--tRNA ligase family protein [Verrucomicrobiota bacterium]